MGSRIFLTLFVCVGIGHGGWGQEANRVSYRGMEGQDIALTQIPDKAVVLFRRGTAASAKRQALADTAEIQRIRRNSKQDYELEDSRRRNIVVPLTISARGGASVARDLRIRLRNGAVIESVNPVYRTESGHEVALTDYFYVSFPAETARQRVDEINAAYAVEVVEVVDYGKTLGRIGYRLLVTEQAELDALELANLYHDLPESIASAPAFAPLYPVQTSADEPNDPLFGPNALPLEACTTSESLHWYQWYLHNDQGVAHINAASAWAEVYDLIDEGADWELKDGMATPVIAIVDCGLTLDYASVDPHPSLAIPSPSANWNYRLASCESYEGHPDLEHAVYDKVWLNPNEAATTEFEDDDFGWDFVGQEPEVLDGGDRIPWPDDPGTMPGEGVNRRHGTMAAGIAAAVGNNATGVAGVCWHAQLMAVRTHFAQYEERGGGNFLFDLYNARGIKYAADAGADIISATGAQVTYSPDLHDAVRHARALGKVVVVASGNANYSMDVHPIYPANFPEVIAVGAIDEEDHRNQHFGLTGGSNFGSALDVVAISRTADCSPWKGPISTTVPCDGGSLLGAFLPGVYHATYPWLSHYAAGSGTSIAFPQVSGAAAMTLTVNPGLSPAEVQACIVFGADAITEDSNQSLTGLNTRNVHFGYGRLNVAEAVRLAKPANRTVLVSTAQIVDHKASIDVDGNLALEGIVIEGLGDSPHLLTGQTGDFALEDGGDKLLRIDQSGTLHLWGNLEEESCLALGAVLFDYIPIEAGSGTTEVGRLSTEEYAPYPKGTLFLQGRVFEGSNPDPDTTLYPYGVVVPHMLDSSLESDYSWPPTGEYTSSYIAIRNESAHPIRLNAHYYDGQGGAMTSSVEPYHVLAGHGSIAFRPFGSNTPAALKSSAANPRNAVIWSSGPITGRLGLGTANDQWAFELPFMPNPSDLGYRNPVNPQSKIVAPYYVDQLNPGFPPSSGVSAWLAVKNLSGFTITCAVQYWDKDANDLTPEYNTFKMKPFQTLGWRPNYHDPDDTTQAKWWDGEAFQPMPSAVVPNPSNPATFSRTATISILSPEGMIVGRVADAAGSGLRAYTMPDAVGSRALLFPYVNDNGEGSWPPSGSATSTYVSIRNVTDDEITLTIRFYPLGGGSAFETFTGVTLDANGTLNWNPYKSSSPGSYQTDEHSEMSIRVEVTSEDGRIVGRMAGGNAWDQFAYTPVDGRGFDRVSVPMAVDNGDTFPSTPGTGISSLYMLQNPGNATGNYLVNYFAFDGSDRTPGTDYFSLGSRVTIVEHPFQVPCGGTLPNATNADSRNGQVTAKDGAKIVGVLRDVQNWGQLAYVMPSHPVLLHEDFLAFDSINGGELEDRWDGDTAKFSIENAFLRRSAFAAESVNIHCEHVVPDGMVRFSYATVDTSSDTLQAIVYLRWKDVDEYIRLEIARGAMRLVRNSGSGDVTLDENTGADSLTGQWYDVLVRLDGYDVDVWRVNRGQWLRPEDGDEILSSNAEIVLTTDYFQIELTEGADYRFDDVVISSLPAEE